MIQDVTETLVDGKRYQIPGLGTFSTCTRKATSDRDECTIAMFRASVELRDFVSGGAQPNLTGPHQELALIIIKAMQNEGDVEIPGLGTLAIVPMQGKRPKITFHGAKQLNSVF